MTSRSQRLTALVVDDDKSTREVTALLLETYGYHAVEAVNGRAALEMIENGEVKPDALVTDHHMPNLSGIDLIRAVHDLGYSIPVMVLASSTIETDPELQLEVVKLGAHPIVKPYRARTLLNLLSA